MTPDERNMISDLANKLAQTPAPPRDPEAEDFIRTRIGSRPDALYLMTQTVLIQNMALQQAQRQISELQQRGGSSVSPVSGGSFLGGGSSAASSSSYAPPQQQYPQPSYAQPSQASYTQPANSGMGGAPSFLRSAAQTAAGVAAGTLAVQGIESLFHGFGGGGSGLGGFGGGLGGFGGGGGRPDETIVNNYYDNPGGGGNLGGGDNLALGDTRDNFADTGDVSDGSDYSDAGLGDDSSFDSSGDDFS